MGEKVDGLRIGFFALRANSSSGRDHRVGRTSAEELTALGIECEGQWTITVGEVFRHVAVICAKTLTTLLNLLLHLSTNILVNRVTIVEVSGQEADVERHD